MITRNFFLCFLLILAGNAFAGRVLTPKKSFAAVVEQSKVAVRPEDLPEAVKSAISSEGYAEWKVSSAYLVTRDNNAQYYEVNLKRMEESVTLNLDKYGKKVD